MHCERPSVCPMTVCTRRRRMSRRTSLTSGLPEDEFAPTTHEVQASAPYLNRRRVLSLAAGLGRPVAVAGIASQWPLVPHPDTMAAVDPASFGSFIEKRHRPQPTHAILHGRVTVSLWQHSRNYFDSSAMERSSTRSAIDSTIREGSRGSAPRVPGSCSPSARAPSAIPPRSRPRYPYPSGRRSSPFPRNGHSGCAAPNAS